MTVNEPPKDRFSDDAPGPRQSSRAGSGKGGWSSHRALPAVIAVLIATVASARAAEALAPVGRTMASEAAAVRLLSEAIVRAVRDLNQDEDDAPAIHPDLLAGRVGDGGESVGRDAPEIGTRPHRTDRLGWHELDRPPPAR